MRCIKEFPSSPFLSSLLIFILLQACAPAPVKEPLHPPYSEHEIKSILTGMQARENAVQSFFSHGRITFQSRDSEVEASVLIVGTRNPIQLKVEITHLWGRPLVHILIRENRIHLISFPEKKYYTGAIGEPFISDLLPTHLDPRLLWAVGRGFPILYEYHHAASPEGNQISLLNREQTVVQRIDFYPESDLPQQAFYSDNGLEISFSDFKNHNHIPFAQKTCLSNHDNETTLRIENKQMVFNRIIADGVFNLAVPPGFTRWHNDPRLDTP